MAGTGPLAVVDIMSTGDRVDVRFTFTETGRTFHLPTSAQRFAAARRDAGVYLGRMVRRIQARLRPRPGRAEDALRCAFNGGEQLLLKLADGDHARILNLQRAFGEAFGEARRGQARDHVVPLIEVRGRNYWFPFEMLPLVGSGAMTDATTLLGLSTNARRLLAFSAVVRRVLPAEGASDVVLRNDPKLPVQFLRYRMRGASREEEFLYKLQSHVLVEGPWPGREDPKEVPDILIDALFDPRRHLPPATQGPPVQIHHFACHCDTRQEIQDDYAIGLSTEKRPSWWRRWADPIVCTITLGLLESGYLHRLNELRQGPREGDPLEVPAASQPIRAPVILNACGSSRTDPVSADCFPKFFIQNGHRAFLGTETDVPDEVAAEFSHLLYRELLGGLDFGNAVVQARRGLLERFHNPLGLLFVMYGEPGLRVECPDPSLLIAS